MCNTENKTVQMNSITEINDAHAAGILHVEKTVE